MIDFRVEFHTELLLYRLHYAALQADDFFRVGFSSVVHKNKRLLIPDRSATASLAFPAALLYHPGGRDLDRTVLQVVVRNLEVGSMLDSGRIIYLLEVFTGDDRVLEETAGTSHDRRLRKLLLADLDYYLADE